MNKVHDDVMDATTCDVLPVLNRIEERALFTYITHGIATYPRPPWTSGGKTTLECSVV